jgi:multidrug efflux system membrane fusion protein
MRSVKVGQRQGDLVVIRDGLKPGENVIMNGQLGVMPGGKVKVVTGAPAAQPAAQPAGK